MYRTIFMPVFLALALTAQAQPIDSTGPIGCSEGRWAAPTYRWVALPDNPGCWAHYLGQYQVGFYSEITDTYRTFSPTTGKYGIAGDPPWGKRKFVGPDLNFGITPGKLNQPEVKSVPNFGIESSKMHDASANDTRYWLNGNPVGRGESFRAVGGDLADDSGKMRLTVIGTEAECKTVLANLEQLPLAKFKDKLVVQTYRPTDWAVQGYGFKLDGKPTIYLQEPSGKVLHRQMDYADGAVGLDRAIQRKLDPNYNADKDADARKTPTVPDFLANLSRTHLAMGAGGAAFLVWLLTRKQAAAKQMADVPVKQAAAKWPVQEMLRKGASKEVAFTLATPTPVTLDGLLQAAAVADKDEDEREAARQREKAARLQRRKEFIAAAHADVKGFVAIANPTAPAAPTP